METDRTTYEEVTGEIGIVIEYEAGVARAKDVMQGALSLIDALDKLDHALLSSIDTSLEPVSILNDVQHSSLKILLKRVLEKIPDEHLKSLDWKKWVGGILVEGKHNLLKKLDASPAEIAIELKRIEPYYKNPPVSGGLIGYETPKIEAIKEALLAVSTARDTQGNSNVTVQTELGDIALPYLNQAKVTEQPEEETSFEGTSRVTLSLVSPVFKDGNKWRFNDGLSDFAAAILDTDFIAQVENGERFGKGDLLAVEMHTIQTRIGFKLNIERTIIKVLKHITPPTQPQLK
jgi:hypothetical protein